MKVGDLIRYRMAWAHDKDGNVISPRTDEKGWSGPTLVVSKYSEEDDYNFLCLDGNHQIVLSGPDECYDIEVINES
jgi:hypothetical protein